MRNSLIKALFGVLFVLVLQVPTCIMASPAAESDGFEEMNGPSKAHDTVSKSSEDDWFAEDSTASGQSTQPAKKEKHAPVYPLVEIGGTTLLLYFVSWLLARLKVMKTATHRKIWNVILLIAFLVSGVLGLMLVVQINYDIWGSWFSTFMWMHVDFGIVMGIVSIFHILWHTKYFGTLVKKKGER